MRLPDFRSAVGRLLVAALATPSVFIVLYVAYSHVASLLAVREYKLASYQALLGSEADLSRFTAIEQGGLSHEVGGGVLRVHGTAASAGVASARFVGPTQRLDDRVETRLRYRVRGSESAPFDVFVGLESADKDVHDPDARRLVLVMRNGAPEPFAIEGDISSDGPRRIATHIGPIASEGDAGASDGWHELSLELAAYVRLASGRADGAPVASGTSRWWMGSRVRMVFGVVAREHGAAVDVELAEVAYDQKERPSKLPSFKERFTSKIIDPRVWTVMLPDVRDAELAYRTDLARGLVVTARSKGQPDFQPFTLLSTPTPLGSFSLRAEFELRALEDASAILGIIGSGYAPPRFIDLAVRGDSAGAVGILVAGHWQANGQVAFTPVTDTRPRTSAVLELKYDAATGDMLCLVDGAIIARQHFDLFPGDTVQFRVGVGVHGPAAKADVALREVSYQR